MYVWVIEMWSDDANQWEPTVDSGITKEDAGRLRRSYWETNHPDDRFREVQYFRSRAKGVDPRSV